MAEVIDKESFNMIPGVSKEEFENSSFIVAGEYTGDGEDSQYIDIGKKPKAVIIMQGGCVTYYQEGNDIAMQGGMVIDGMPLIYNGQNLVMATITNTGFTVNHYSRSVTFNDISLNADGSKYKYIALF